MSWASQFGYGFFLLVLNISVHTSSWRTKECFSQKYIGKWFECFYIIGGENKMFASVFMTSDDLVISFQP